MAAPDGRRDQEAAARQPGGQRDGRRQQAAEPVHRDERPGQHHPPASAPRTNHAYVTTQWRPRLRSPSDVMLPSIDCPHGDQAARTAARTARASTAAARICRASSTSHAVGERPPVSLQLRRRHGGGVELEHLAAHVPLDADGVSGAEVLLEPIAARPRETSIRTVARMPSTSPTSAGGAVGAEEGDEIEQALADDDRLAQARPAGADALEGGVVAPASDQPRVGPTRSPPRARRWEATACSTRRRWRRPDAWSGASGPRSRSGRRGSGASWRSGRAVPCP